MNKEFRDYKNVQDVIKENYKLNRINQTYSHVKNMHKNYLHFSHKYKIFIWDAFFALNDFIDISDPDVSLPNSHHAFQTAEAIRKDNHPDWMQLVGLIHDLGKIMYLKGCDEDGTSINKQWGIVGDTFIVGCKIPDSIIFSEFNELNKDMKNEKFNTKNGIYKQNCGLKNTLCSWGHDEYLYQVLKYNKCRLPEEALYIIRYHSLYVHHTKHAYEYLMDDEDINNLELLKIFNKYDLYTKSEKTYNINEMKLYYDKLIKKYFHSDVIYF